MRERLTSADHRFLLVCAVLLGLTVWFSATNFYQAFPEASIDFRVTRDQARATAETFLGAQQHDVRAYREASRFGFDDRAKTFLERELGLEQANRLMGSRVRLWRWSERWFRPLQKEQYRVDVTTAGQVVGFSHEIREEEARPAATPEQARTLAESFLKEKMGRDPAGLEFIGSSAVARPARLDQVVTWKERGFDIHQATYRMEVTVLGNEIGEYREYLKIPETWLRDYERLRSKNEAAQTFDTVVMVLLLVGLLVIIVTRLRLRDVRWGRAGVVGAIGAALSFFSSWNSMPLAQFNYPTTDSYGSFLAQQVMQNLLASLGLGALLFVLTAGAEPLYRQYFSARLSLRNLFAPRGLATKSFFKGTVLGLTLAGIFVAYQIVFYLVAYRLGAWSPADVNYDDLLNTRFPWLFVMFGGFFPAVSEEFLFRMFAIPFLRRLLRVGWLAVVLAGFIWGFGHAGYPQQPFYIRGLEVGIGGVALGLIMLRWGILPTLVWHYSVDAILTALLLLRSHNLYFVLSGAASAGIMVLPVLVAWILYLRRQGFEPEAGLTNGDEQPAAPPALEPAPVTAEAAPSDYRPLGAGRRLLGFGIAAACAAFLLVPVEQFGDKPGFALGAKQAQAAADRFLRERGLDPAKFRTALFPRNRADDLVIRYFLEHTTVAALARAWHRDNPLEVWLLRYFRPLEKEEIRVSLDPESGRVVGFAHTLPEDAPGADIQPEDARGIASVFLAGRGFDLSTLELKETTSERKKNRRDYSLVWEARPGDPRNIAEAHYRVLTQVAGDKVAAMELYWKLPEAFTRARQRENLLAILLLVLRIAFIALGAMLALWLIVQATRRRELRWSVVIRATVPFTALAVLGSILQAPLMLRGYDTAIPFETFQATLVAGLVMSAVGVFLGLSCSMALLLAVQPDCLDALRSARRRVGLADNLVAVVVAVALAVLAGRLEWLAIDRFHAHAIVSVSQPPGLGTWFPALGVAAGAFGGVLARLAVLALVCHVAARMLRSRWKVLAVGLAGVAAFVPREVRTLSEFALHYCILLTMAAACWIFIRWFARGNVLAYLLAAATLGLGGRAMALLEQPNAALHLQGSAVLAALAAVLAWAVWPALARGRGSDAAAAAAFPAR